MVRARRQKRFQTTPTPKSSSQNPFQAKWAHSKAIEARRQIRATKTRNTVIDKRIAEHDPNITDADRYLLRLQRERSKKNKKAARFNLNDRDDFDGDLTLSNNNDVGDDDDDDENDDEDNDGDGFFKLKSDDPENKDDGEATGEEDGDDGSAPRTKREIMSEVMKKSKDFKAQRQHEKHHTDEQIAGLDANLNQVMKLLQLKTEEDEPVEEQDSFLLENLANLPEMGLQSNKSNDSEKKKNETSDFHYESAYQLLAAEKRARPSERLLTEEEAAEKEHERLVKLEILRQKRMRNIEDDEDRDDDDRKPLRGKKRKGGADDLDDSFQLGANEDDDGDESDEGDDDSMSESQQDDDDGNDVEYPKSSDKVAKDDGDGDDNEKSPVGSRASFWDSFFIKEVCACRDSEDDKEIPFVFNKCPSTGNELQEIFTDTSVKQRDIILERLRKCFAISLNPAKNQPRLQRLLECILFRIERLAEVNEKPLFELTILEIDMLVMHVHSFAATFDRTIATWARARISECAFPLLKKKSTDTLDTHKNDSDGDKDDSNALSMVWCSKQIILMRTIVTLYPSSDLRHSVVTPLIMVLSEALAPSRISSFLDVAYGCFVALVLMQAMSGRSGYSPELALFISKVLRACYAPKKSNEKNVQQFTVDPCDQKVQEMLSGVEIAGDFDEAVKLKLSVVELFDDDDEMAILFAKGIVQSVVGLAEAWFTEWTPHVDIVLAEVCPANIQASSVRQRIDAIFQSASKTHSNAMRKPLTLYTKKERTMVKVINPRMHCEDNGVFFKRGRSKFGGGPPGLDEAGASAKRVRRALRKAVRGQARDVRVEAAAEAHTRLEEEDQRRERANARDKEVRAFFEHQRSTWRAHEKKQKKLSGTVRQVHAFDNMSHPQQLCEVVDCQNGYRYKCPRCDIRYCSALCYGKHSDGCVDAFRDEDLQALRGKKVSDVERRRFGAILKRLQDDEGCGAFLYSSNTKNSDVRLGTRPSSSNVISENEDDKDADAASLLTQLIETLDNDGKDALFSVLHRSMDSLETTVQPEKSKPKTERAPTKTDKKRARRGARGEKNMKLGSSEFDENENEITEELEDLLEDMELTDMDYEEILERLPLPLRKDLETRLREGRIQDLIKPWTPWWTAGNGNDNGHVETEDTQSLPSLPETSDLKVPVAQARAIASQTLIFNVIDVVSSYCLAMRLSNGDWNVDAEGTARDLWTTSAVLEDDARHKSLQEVCHSVNKRSRNGTGATALKDCADIFCRTSSAVVRALFDAAKIAELAAIETKMDKSSKRRVKGISKGYHKLMFFVSWALAESTQHFLSLARKLLTVEQVDEGRAEELVIAKQATKEISETDAPLLLS